MEDGNADTKLCCFLQGGELWRLCVGDVVDAQSCLAHLARLQSESRDLANVRYTIRV